MNIFEAEAEHFERTMRDILLNYKDDEEACHSSIEKLRARYPDGFDADHSLHRQPGDI